MGNSERNPIDKIYIRGNGTTNVYWDDVTISEVSTINPASLSDEEIKEIYKDYTENIFDWEGGKRLNSVTFKNIKPLQNYVKKYRINNRGFAYPEHTINQVRDSYEVGANGSVKVNMLDYNKGNGIDIGFLGEDTL
ncbi:hypothetical protein CBR59_30080 [Bacillus thuringiensis]|uniref:hypothetical protein n=1 Tax=Bacillus thuringiensis TaxID=1428 RepID=UPI000C9E2435|nr:hypothetical protein [Bacillus thuringiensis]PNK22773.1 hypothetical protein CBP87_30290 [Bacillus thuringiensis]PNK46209.1 hypothetical protein CBR59_30080 [Bacillus thuringiensis]